MVEHLNQRAQHRAFRFEGFSFAQAVLVHGIFRYVHGAQNVFPTGRPFPKSPTHPSAIAVFDEKPTRRVLIDSESRIPKLLKQKKGFSQLERRYQEMVEGFKMAHNGQPLELQVWSFDANGRKDIFEKLVKRLDVKSTWVGPAEIAAMLTALEGAVGPELLLHDDLGALLALMGSLKSTPKATEAVEKK